MEKFSLYDLLAVLFPGLIGLLLLQLLNKLYCIVPAFSWVANWQLLVVASLIAGAILYATSFLLTKKCRWFYRFLKIYRPVSELYREDPNAALWAETFNRKTQEWYAAKVFYTQEEYRDLKTDERQKADKQQDEFYDRMYYMLDYAGKLDTPKAFQSFYLFFRNLLLVSVGIALTWILLMLISPLPFVFLRTPSFAYLILLFIGLLFLFLSSLWLAQWYRRRMLHKMYWFFYSYIHAPK